MVTTLLIALAPLTCNGQPCPNGITTAPWITPKQTVNLVVRKECVKELTAGKKFECRGPNQDNLTCTGAVVKFDPKCARFEVERKKK